MARDRAGGDLLGTIERCLTAVRDQADAAGVVLDLVIPVNPALVQVDTTPLDEIGRTLLRYAIAGSQRGHRLQVRLDMKVDDIVILEIDEEASETDYASIHGAARQKDALAADVEPIRAIVGAVGGELSVSHKDNGLLRLSATLPWSPGVDSSP